MIEIPVHNLEGVQVDALQIDEQALGGEVRPSLLKQAYVYYHANRRQGSAHTHGRADVEGSTRKLYKQKGTGNARRGEAGTNLMRHGGHAHAKRARSWRNDMPIKMRRLATRNAFLAKIVDGEVKLLDKLSFEKPSAKQFAQLLTKLNIDRTCLVALSDTRTHTARSAANLEHVRLTSINRLNAFDLLNHRYLVAERSVLEGWLQQASNQGSAKEAS